MRGTTCKLRRVLSEFSSSIAIISEEIYIKSEYKGMPSHHYFFISTRIAEDRIQNFSEVPTATSVASLAHGLVMNILLSSL